MSSETPPVDNTARPAKIVEQYFDAITDVDIRLLRMFCVVVSAGGLSPATTELQADLSTVSRYLKELEDAVGARLCNRGRSGFSLTAHGVLVHGAAQELFQALRSFREKVNGLRTDPVGELKLGIMDALLSDPQFKMAAALHAYRARAPRVRIALSVGKPLDIERQVANGNLDAGVVASTGETLGLSCHPLYKETSSLYCSDNHPLYVRPDPCLHGGEIGSLDLVEDPYTESVPMHGWAPLFRRAARADSLEGVALLVSSGDYVGFLPDHYAEMLKPSTPLRSLWPDLFRYEQRIDLVLRTGPMNPFVQGVVAELFAGREQPGDDPHQGRPA
jgi:DNA-binding transcriptional LysR family regulator